MTWLVVLIAFASLGFGGFVGWHLREMTIPTAEELSEGLIARYDDEFEDIAPW